MSRFNLRRFTPARSPNFQIEAEISQKPQSPGLFWVALFLRVQALVQTAKHPAAVRRDRQPRQHCGDRAADRDDQARRSDGHDDSLSPRENAAAHPFDRRVVQRTSPPYDAQGRHAERAVFREVPGKQETADRTATAVAPRFALRPSSRARRRQTRRSLRHRACRR